MQKPKVKIGWQTWVQIAQEVSKWAEHGKELGKDPLECVFYPLTQVVLSKNRTFTPFDTISLSDVEEFIISAVFIPPHKYANYSACAASFVAPNGDLEKMQKVFTEGIDLQLMFHPQLYFLGPGHSHPFSVDSTAPSTTDINHHMQPYRLKNEKLLGFRFSLALIVVQTSDNVLCELKKGYPSNYFKYLNWQACAFVLDENEKVQNLGIAKISKHNELPTKPFYRSSKGTIWESLQKSFLGEKLIEHQRWPGAWTSFLIKQDLENATLVMLPSNFPIQPAVKQTISLVTKQASSAELWSCGRSYKNYCLGEVNNVNHPREK